MIQKKLWFNSTYDRLLWLQRLSLLATAWKHRKYVKLVYSFFFWLYFTKGCAPFLSFSFCFYRHLVLSDGSAGKYFTGNFTWSLFFWSDLLWIFVRSDKLHIFFLGNFPVNWVHVRFILRPLRRALVLVVCAIHIFIANCLNLFVSLNCIFSRLPTSLLLVSSDSPSSCTNEVSCTEELNRIPALVSRKTESICSKELRNYNRKLYLCSPQNYAETQPTFYTVIFQNKFTLWHIRPHIYIWKTKFTSYKQYFFGLPFSRKAKNADADQSILR